MPMNPLFMNFPQGQEGDFAVGQAPMPGQAQLPGVPGQDPQQQPVNILLMLFLSTL